MVDLLQSRYPAILSMPTGEELEQIALLRGPSIQAQDPSLRERVGNLIYDAASAVGLRGQANRMRDEGTVAADFMPGIGDVVGFDDAKRDFDAGNYGSAAFNAGTSLVGVVPGAGDLAAGVAKAIFGGMAAKTADRAALETAQQLAATGADRQAIWDATGWFQGPDGQWRFEIDDSGSRLRNSTDERSIKKRSGLDESFQHDELYQAYPELADHKYRVDYADGGRSQGYYLPGEIGISPFTLRNRSDARSVTLHEAQHAIQQREGFARGSSPNAMGIPQDDLWAAAKKAYLDSDQDAAILRELGIDTPDVQLKPWEELSRREQLEWLQRGRNSLYHRSAGEVEARNVQTRMNMTPEQRMATPPWETEDVPFSQQIVR